MIHAVKLWAPSSLAFRKLTLVSQICGSNILIASEKPSIEVYPFG